MVKRVGKYAVLFLVLSLLYSAVASAQENPAGRLTGTVTDQQGRIIPRATVSVKNNQTGFESRTVANEVGVWETSSIPAGSYILSIAAPPSFSPYIDEVKVETGVAKTVDVTLHIGLENEVTVTASKYEEEVINAPATVSVVPEQAIQATASYNIAELLRAVPGVNVIQTSAITFNVSSRSAASAATNHQLALVDGRTIYWDFLGYSDWNMVTEDLDEVKQMEVVRGPASAIWGAYAMNGVVNIVTKPPREMLGTTFTVGIGTFDRSGGAAESGTGSLYYAKVAHARALNDRWAYKITGGGYTQDAFARPEGTIPNAFHTPYPLYPNRDMTQIKVDGRVDYDLSAGKQHFTFAGGFGPIKGIYNTSIGPGDCWSCNFGYGKVDYVRGALRISSFVNFVVYDMPILLFRDPTGRHLPWGGDAQAYDIGFSNFHAIAGKHLISYGGNMRYNEFHHCAIPGATNRTDGGVYFEDKFFLSKHFSWVFGVRIDKFENLKGAVFSPRTTFIVKPAAGQTFRISYNRAYVAPAPIENFMKFTFMSLLDLGLLDPQLAGNYFSFPVRVEGNKNLEEKSLNAYEVGYAARVAKGRANFGVAFYINDSRGQFHNLVTRTYTSQNPPSGWPLPPIVLDLMNDAGMGLPELISNENLGKVRNKGLELSLDVQISRFIKGYVNYSWQARPVSKEYDVSLYNLPPTHRFNAGTNFDYKRYFGNVNVGYVGSAFWNDVMNDAYSGTTEAYTTVNLGAGVRWGKNRKYTAMLKVSNLANTPIQNHIFGDILRRQITGEFKMRF